MDCSQDVPQGFHYVGTLIRPPSEADSILIQATVGCSHNKCSFCGTYKDKRFAIKPKEILERDLAFAERYCRHQKRVFFMDGDPLIMPMARWRWLLGEVRRRLPWVERVGTYANSKAIAMKTDEELAELRELGLGIIYYGIETGHPQVLKDINKGATPEKLLTQGLRVRKAGIKLSVTVLLGIGGVELSLEHARATGELLTRLDPEYVGALTLILIPGTPLAAKAARGEFRMPGPRGMLVELKEMLAATELSEGHRFYANHASNYLPIKVRFPEDKAPALELLEAAINGQVGLRPEWMRAL